LSPEVTEETVSPGKRSARNETGFGVCFNNTRLYVMQNLSFDSDGVNRKSIALATVLSGLVHYPLSVDFNYARPFVSALLSSTIAIYDLI